eukprot:gene2968-3238_t
MKLSLPEHILMDSDLDGTHFINRRYDLKTCSFHSRQWPSFEQLYSFVSKAKNNAPTGTGGPKPKTQYTYVAKDGTIKTVTSRTHGAANSRKSIKQQAPFPSLFYYMHSQQMAKTLLAGPIPVQ